MKKMVPSPLSEHSYTAKSTPPFHEKGAIEMEGAQAFSASHGGPKDSVSMASFTGLESPDSWGQD